MEQPTHESPLSLSAEHIIRAYRMLSAEQIAEYDVKIRPDEPPVLFPCPPVCPPILV
jgi:hypothetical protein